MCRIHLAGVVCAAILLAACSGGSAFIPAIGPFSGQFVVGEEAIGSFAFTTGGGQLGGTGMLIHNEQTVTVSLSATIDGWTISGTVANASLGSGDFTGTFSDANRAGGEFDYTDAAGLTTASGTWEAQPE